MNVAIIPARAGSQGVIGKNTRLINDKPLVAWTIEAALASSKIDAIVVSSNCPRVEQITKKYQQDAQWLYFIHRPEELCGPLCSTESAMIHALEESRELFGKMPDWVTLLQPTSPVRNNELINKCCSQVLGSRHDSLMTVSAHTPFLYRKDMNETGTGINHNPCKRVMRQELRPDDLVYHDCGNVYLTRLDKLIEKQCRIGDSLRLFEVTDYQSWQIDKQEDFIILESMAKAFGSFI